jgi:hypothetical protein
MKNSKEKDMAKGVRVKFPMSQEIWDKVITENTYVESSDEFIVEIEENSDNFVVTYASEEDYQDALVRFEGLVEHEVLK